MKSVASLVTFLLVLSAISCAQGARSASRLTKPPEETDAPRPGTITGCLAGHPDNYRLTEKDGTMHLLMGEAVALDRHVGHIVELVGYKDNDRDASASSDEGYPGWVALFLGRRDYFRLWQMQVTVRPADDTEWLS